MSKQSNDSLHKYSVEFGTWVFSCNFINTILLIIALVVFISLGGWQLGKARMKTAMIASLTSKAVELPINLVSLENASLADRYTPVYVEGIYLNQHTFLLDNQMFGHNVGYRVLTPVQVPNLDKWVLIDRGWVPMGVDRSQLPAIADIFGLQYLPGIINHIGSGIVLQADQVDLNAHGPIVIQSLNYDFIAQQLRHQVFNFVVQLRTPEITPYAIPPLEFGVSSAKHFSYAVQWFIFAGLAFIYYLITSISRRK